MKIITTASEMIEFSAAQKAATATIGFVPTMGALHEGHVSLIRAAKEHNDKVIVSVFVNPTQFNQASDLENYPRTFNEDKEVLEREGIAVMFFPSVEEIYPDSTSPNYDLDGLDLGMEGPNRPGHFNGVVQVVTRLFDLTAPTNAYFGEKDFQQLAIIKHMTDKLGYSINIIGCPTLRQPDGLAMSSRNTRLSREGKLSATHINKALFSIKSLIREGQTLSKAIDSAKANLSVNSNLELEYIEAVNPITLQPATNEDSGVQVCIATWVEGVRLIDNMRVK